MIGIKLLTLTATILLASLQLSHAQMPADKSLPQAAPPAAQFRVRIAEMMGGMAPGQPAPGAMQPSMQAQPGQMPPAMPMMNDRTGGMPPQRIPAPPAAAARMREMEMGMPNMPPMGQSGGMTALPYDHVEGRIAFLQAELGVTDAQISQWHAFADAMRTAAQSMRAAVSAQATGMPGSVPERDQQEIQWLSARLDAMRTLHAARVSLYLVLSNDQKKIADELMN